MAKSEQPKPKPRKADAAKPPSRPRLVLRPRLSVSGHGVDPDDLEIFKDHRYGNAGDMVSGSAGPR